jgi:natural product biosynthesis luciferase-like monooxygenase protein
MEFGIMFFSSADEAGGDKYRLLLDATRVADARGFRAVWTPERHFDAFGGLFPNPSLTSAALATITSRLQLRAGSLIAPLHDPIRMAEEWSVVDNLSGGRVAVSFGSGWNVQDFVFFPDRYARRQAVMYEEIETVRALWRGETIVRANGDAPDVTVRLHPTPVQPELPIWITTSGNVDTFVSAGRRGANVLTHLVGQTLSELAEKIRGYRESRERAGFDPDSGIVSLMLHTFIGASDADVMALVKAPFCTYLESAVRLETRAAAGGGVISGGRRIEPHGIQPDTMAELLEVTFRRYFETASLMGTPERCRRMVWQLIDAGVNEIACLIDFGPPYADVMQSLHRLADLRATFVDETLSRAAVNLTEAFVGPLDS